MIEKFEGCACRRCKVPASATPIQAPMSSTPSFRATYVQTRHAIQTEMKSSALYKSYEDAVGAIMTYFTDRRGRYPNEVFRIIVSGTRYDEKELTVPIGTDLSPILREYSEDITVHGKTCCIELTLDGTTNYGSPTLQIVTLSDPALVEAVREAERADRLAKYGLHYCNDPDCDHDCGMLSCSCIDTCRGRCGCDSPESWYY